MAQSANGAGRLEALEPKSPPQAGPERRNQIENEKLRKEKDKLAKELAQTTEAALEIVGKAHALLEMLSESADSEPKPEK